MLPSANEPIHGDTTLVERRSTLNTGRLPRHPFMLRRADAGRWAGRIEPEIAGRSGADLGQLEVADYGEIPTSWGVF